MKRCELISMFICLGSAVLIGYLVHSCRLRHTDLSRGDGIVSVGDFGTVVTPPQTGSWGGTGVTFLIMGTDKGDIDLRVDRSVTYTNGQKISYGEWKDLTRGVSGE